MRRGGRRRHRSEGAERAGVGLLPRVPPLVDADVAALRAPEVAEAAHEGLLPRVGPLVQSDLQIMATMGHQREATTKCRLQLEVAQLE